MPRPRTFPGRLKQLERPDWDPLIDLVGLVLVRSFMWMNEIELEDGTRRARLQAHLDAPVRARRRGRPACSSTAGPAATARWTRTQALELAFFAWSPDEADAREALEELMKWSTT